MMFPEDYGDEPGTDELLARSEISGDVPLAIILDLMRIAWEEEEESSRPSEDYADEPGTDEQLARSEMSGDVPNCVILDLMRKTSEEEMTRGAGGSPMPDLDIGLPLNLQLHR
jgi:hypothetical protein